jgi:GTP-binding protein
VKVETRIVDAEFVAGAPSVAKLPPPALAEVAFAGRSNVGKSSLMNMLMSRKGLVRASNTPGRTREINVFLAKSLDGLALHLVDLPGYGYAKVSKAERKSWGPMMEGYLASRTTLRAVVMLVDVRRGVEEDDLELVHYMEEAREANRVEENKAVTLIVVATKLDKLALSKQKPAVQAIKDAAKVPVLGFSAVTGTGRDELWARIRAAL